MTEKRPNHRPPKGRAIDPEQLDSSFMTVEEVADVCAQVYDINFLWNHNVEQFIEMAEEILKIVG